MNYEDILLQKLGYKPSGAIMKTHSIKPIGKALSSSIDADGTVVCEVELDLSNPAVIAIIAAYQNGGSEAAYHELLHQKASECN